MGRVTTQFVSRGRPASPKNGDNLFVGELDNLWIGVVCDGVSSGQYAHLASEYAAMEIKGILHRKGMLFTKETIIPEINRISNAIRKKWKGCAHTTFSLLVLDTNAQTYMIATIGDTGIYHSRNNEPFRKISEDQTALLRAGHKVLEQALGMAKIKPVIRQGLFLDGDRFAIASDGVAERFFIRKKTIDENGLMEIVRKSQADIMDDATILVATVNPPVNAAHPQPEKSITESPKWTHRLQRILKLA